MGIFDGFPPEGSNPPPKRSKRDRIERLRKRANAITPQTDMSPSDPVTQLLSVFKGLLDLLDDEL